MFVNSIPNLYMTCGVGGLVNRTRYVVLPKTLAS